MILAIKAGTVVTWTNTDDEPHTVGSDCGSFHTGAAQADDSFTFKFDKPGTYHYTFSTHPRLIVTVVVE